uniref:protein-serine/threonine phosphatase n=1 Tax=Arcella intermedia TaxID=1963864 RepID=A0A6B2LD04_9EUKA
MKKSPNVITLTAPAVVVGNVQGQYDDLLEIFTKASFPPEGQYLFLGDFINRGKQSVEVLTLLLLLKLRHPARVHLLRGHHEAHQMMSVYGALDELAAKYADAHRALVPCIVEVFDALPLAAVVECQGKRFFAVHGGLSPEVRFIAEVDALDRVKVEEYGPVVDLLWSDPEEIDEAWSAGSRRCGGFAFGEKAVDGFLRDNGLDKILRSHQLVMEGFQCFFDGKVTTLWSASEYMGRINNLGAFLEIDAKGQETYNTFSLKRLA